MKWSKMVPELTVSNFDVSLDFYTRVLGFQIVHERQEPDFVYLDLDGAQLMLEAHHHEGWNTGVLEKPFGRGVNLQIEVEDVESVFSSVARSRIPLFRPLRESWYMVSEEKEEGQKEFLVQDPDGFLLRFSQYLGDRSLARDS